MASSALVWCYCIQVLAKLCAASLSASSQPARPLVAATWVHTRDVRRSLSDVMADTLSNEHRKATDVRIDRLTETLRPIYMVLPKNKKGLLEHSTVRYALHRHFAHQQ